MKKFLLALLLLMFTFAPAIGQETTPFYCTKPPIVYDASTIGATQVQAAATAGPARVSVCSWIVTTNAAVSVGLVYGTGVNCAIGQVKLTPAYQFLATTSGIAGFNDGSNQWRGMQVPAGNNLCVNTSAAVAVQVQIYWDFW
jgi:hypothetical protein